MKANAPQTRAGEVAWQLAQQPGLWSQIAVATMSGGFIMTQGLDHASAQRHAAALYPDIDKHLLHACLRAVEMARLKVEAEVRKAAE